MPTNFPGAKDTAATTLPNTRTNSTTTSTNHPGDHNNYADAIIAIENKLGVDGSADAASIDYLVKKQPFSKGATILDPAGAVNVVVWRAPYACTVTAVRGMRTGGTGATINARKNGASNHLASALSLATAGAFQSNTTIANATYAAGDYLELMLVSIAGTPTSIVMQVDFEKA